MLGFNLCRQNGEVTATTEIGYGRSRIGNTLYSSILRFRALKHTIREAIILAIRTWGGEAILRF